MSDLVDESPDNFIASALVQGLDGPSSLSSSPLPFGAPSDLSSAHSLPPSAPLLDLMRALQEDGVAARCEALERLPVSALLVHLKALLRLPLLRLHPEEGLAHPYALGRHPCLREEVLACVRHVQYVLLKHRMAQPGVLAHHPQCAQSVLEAHQAKQSVQTILTQLSDARQLVLRCPDAANPSAQSSALNACNPLSSLPTRYGVLVNPTKSTHGPLVLSSAGHQVGPSFCSPFSKGDQAQRFSSLLFPHPKIFGEIPSSVMNSCFYASFDQPFSTLQLSSSNPRNLSDSTTTTTTSSSSTTSSSLSSSSLSTSKPPSFFESCIDLVRDFLEPLANKMKFGIMKDEETDPTLILYTNLENSECVFSIYFTDFSFKRVSKVVYANESDGDTDPHKVQLEAELSRLLISPSPSHLLRFRTLVTEIANYDELCHLHPQIDIPGRFRAIFEQIVRPHLETTLRGSYLSLSGITLTYSLGFSTSSASPLPYRAHCGIEVLPKHHQPRIEGWDSDIPLGFTLHLDPPVPMGYLTATRLWQLAFSHHDGEKTPPRYRPKSLATVQSMIRGDRHPLMLFHTGRFHQYMETSATGGEAPIIVQSIPFYRSTDLPGIIDVLRQQITWNSLYSSLFSPFDRTLLPSSVSSSLRTTIEVSSCSPNSIILSTISPHSIHSLFTLQFSIQPDGTISPSLQGSPKEISPLILLKLLNVSHSIPLLFQKLLNFSQS